ncbi:hypothetical protein ACFQ08_31630, partial [Streptosporangium algeriense]
MAAGPDTLPGTGASHAGRPRLTGYAHGGGCACKIPPGELEAVVAGLLSGDLARIDEEGFVYVVDRAKDMVIRG